VSAKVLRTQHPPLVEATRSVSRRSAIPPRRDALRADHVDDTAWW
jgi:hypothetical protein